MKKHNSEDIARAMTALLDCPCTYFPAMKDDDELVAAFRAAQERGKAEGFTPVIVSVSDDTLLECITQSMSSDLSGPDGYDVDVEAARAYRRDLLSTAEASGEEVLHRLFAVQEEYIDEERYGFNGPLADGSDIPKSEDRFFGYWNFITRKTLPVIIAELPTDKPWQIFAWLPMGGWNECPDTSDMMAVSRSWYERYGAVPCVITSDTLDFELPRPIPVTDAMRLAREHYAFCPDVLDSAAEEYSAGMLGASLLKTRYWTFWWD